MQVIPVIDVRFGHVVRAIGGHRVDYEPIVSPLFEGSDPQFAAAGLMALHPFPVIYVADLDAIEQRQANPGLFATIVEQHPAVAVWVDQGARHRDAVAQQLLVDAVSVVVGSETGITAEELRDLVCRFGPRLILSLDFRAEGFVGKPELLDDATCWPDRVIVMTLDRVGGVSGPNCKTIAAITARARQGTQIYAAGGVRDGNDLRALAAMGVTGALVSSALHAQTITADDLDEIADRLVRHSGHE